MNKRVLILHLIATQGQGKSLADIKASAKQTVKAPSSFDNLNKQLGFWGGAFQIFFGTKSVGTMNIEKLIEKVQERKMWRDKCLLTDDCLEVDDSNLNFNTIINKIAFRVYSVNLSRTFNFETKKNPHKEHDDNDGLSNKKKSKKETKKKSITNRDQHFDFKMTEGESWKTTF
eukprot:5044740-Ditylum_brightwellii.AAC.1